MDTTMDVDKTSPETQVSDMDKHHSPVTPPETVPLTSQQDADPPKPVAEPPKAVDDTPTRLSEPPSAISDETPRPPPGPIPPLPAPMIRTNSFGSFLQPAAISHASLPSSSSAPQTPPTLPGIAYVDSQAADRPLNVTDALSYLDAVKNQFQDQPDVYNHFLDIMKDFKSQLIDTPGVIKRVSHLFNGHRMLIQGFNTFLPAGYRIECSTDAQDNLITVTTPTGTMMQTTNNGPGKGIQWSTTSNALDWTKSPGSGSSISTAAATAGNSTVPPNAQLHPNSASRDQSPDQEMKEALPIGPAIEYVARIKEQVDADTYKGFLAILAKYNHALGVKDQREVTAQVTQLFQNYPELRADFREWVAEKNSFFEDQGDIGSTLPRTGTPNEAKASKRKHEPLPLTLADTQSVPQKRRKKMIDKEKELLPLKTAPNAKPKKPKQQHSTGNDVPSTIYSHGKYPSSPRRQPQATSSRAPPPAAPVPAHDETHFFDRVKRLLDNRETYNEFLKLVNLFTQDYIDMVRLVKDSRNFLGEGELMRQFKEILGWDERRERESWNAEGQGWVRPVGSAGLLDRPSRAELSVRFGSYRKLPASEVNVTCSGRDDMCKSVLNDEWVSHPTWSSDDSGFVAHKKNVYEEALHRSEEERHEYDFHIEAIVRTIGMLEPINNKIAQLSQEERGSHKLRPNFGGSGKSIHQRVIKKIYGREAGLEVIQAMQETPALAVPVVLQRLKQKEEEWKRAQREWNKVWREVDARNYAKSLDCQGITFKAVDKKAITTKAFVGQIEAARDEQMAKRASLIDPLFSRTRRRHHLQFLMDDQGVLQDAIKLTLCFLDRTQGQIGFGDRKKIEGFLRSFVPLLFLLDPVKFNAEFAILQDFAVNPDSDASDDVGSAVDDVEVSSVVSGSGSSRGGARSHRKGVGSSGGDLRKKLLKSEQAKSTGRKTRAQEAASPSTSRLASPALTEADNLSENRPSDADSNNRAPLKKRNSFFSNTVFYVLLRLLEVLYSRLSLFKGIAAKLANGEHFYSMLLESCESLFDNKLEQQVFEDQMRYMFGTKNAFKIFTIDKLIGAVIKQVMAVMAEPKSQDLLEILKRDATIPTCNAQDLINSRRNAEKVLGPDENLFRLDWLSDSKTMTFQLLGKDDSSFDDSEVLTGRWQAYIDSFVASEQTEGLTHSRVKRPFLRKNLSPAFDGGQPDVFASGSLEIKVCVRTYRLFFVSGTEDFLCRRLSKEESEKAASMLWTKNSMRRKWMETIGKGEGVFANTL